MSDWIMAIAKMSEGRATRSTALQPLLWMIALLSIATAGTSVQGPLWLMILFASLTAMVVAVSLVMYCRFASKDTNLLRSEKFLIRKMELEQAAIGDNLLGTTASPTSGVPQLLPPTTGGAP